MRRLSNNSYSWAIMGCCALFLFYKYVLQVSPSVITEDLMRVFHINGAGLGNLAATYFYAYSVMQIFSGPLLDRYSPRYLTALAIASCAAGAFLFAHAQSLIIAEISRALMGIGTAFATVSYLKMSAMHFQSDKTAFVDGLLATAAMAGALCGQVPLALLVSHAGWRESLDYCSLGGFILAALFLWGVKEKNAAPTASASSLSQSKMIKFTDFFRLLKNPQNWLLTLYSGFAFAPVAVLGGLWGNPFLETTHHLNATQAASFTSCMFLGLAIGGPLFGLFADRLGQIKTMMGGTLLGLISLMPILYIDDLSNGILASLLFITGLGIGSFMSCYTLGKALNSVRLAATIVALINTGDALFISVTEPLVGKILDLEWTGKTVNHVHSFSPHAFHMAFLMLPCYLLAALMCLYMLHQYKTKNID